MRKMTKDEIKKYEENPNMVLEIAGDHFRCKCECNVFHHPGDDADVFKCNACGAIYETE